MITIALAVAGFVVGAFAGFAVGHYVGVGDGYTERSNGEPGSAFKSNSSEKISTKGKMK